MLPEKLLTIFGSRKIGQAIGLYLSEEDGFGVALWLNATSSTAVRLTGETPFKCDVIRSRENLKPGGGYNENEIRWLTFVPEVGFNSLVFAGAYASAVEKATLIPENDGEESGWVETVWRFWEKANIDKRIEIARIACVRPEEQCAVVIVSNLNQLVSTGKLNDLVFVAKIYPWMFCD